jgi:hypothetical protein
MNDFIVAKTAIPTNDRDPGGPTYYYLEMAKE